MLYLFWCGRKIAFMLLECTNCEAVVDAVVLKEHEDGGADGPPATWYFCNCPRCSDPILAYKYFFEDEGDAPTRAYPSTTRRQLGGAVPKPIREAFDEAVTCFKSKAYTASAIMCRKTLEGLCDSHGAKAGNLSRNLAQLQKDGVIEKNLYAWAEALRISGNEAAHGVGTTISRSDCEDILEFTEALAEYVFTYRDKFAKFMARRTPPKAGEVELSPDDVPF